MEDRHQNIHLTHGTTDISSAEIVPHMTDHELAQLTYKQLLALNDRIEAAVRAATRVNSGPIDVSRNYCHSQAVDKIITFFSTA